MKSIFRKLCFKALENLEILFVPCLYVSSYLMKFVREIGIKKMNISRNIFYKVGVYPLIDHYYDPLFNPKHIRKSLREDRQLPGVDLNVEGQLKLLNDFKDYNTELLEIPIEKADELGFYYHNDMFQSGDAEILYIMIRHFKPNRIIEVGSGYSTRLAVRAINFNKKENPHYNCEHICIEPYERKEWLEKLHVKVIREKVEDVEKNIFEKLDENDFLFIDSSHMIRAQGDVLFEYQEVLPIVKSGVIIHVHDIFTPKDYLDEWVNDVEKFFNEQYLLESFLCYNDKYKVIAALNYLKHNHFNEIAAKCPILKNELYREPGSFWISRK